MKGGGVGMPLEYFGGTEKTGIWDYNLGNSTSVGGDGFARAGFEVS